MALATNSLNLCVAALCLIGFAASLRAQNPGRSTEPKPPSANPVPQSVQSQQENFSLELMQQLQAIKTAALSDEYAYQQLAHLTENIGARPSGSAGAKAAVAYVAAQMRDLGLDVHLEEVKVRRWVRGVETAALVEYPGNAQLLWFCRAHKKGPQPANCPKPTVGLMLPSLIVEELP